jgi:transcriptional/translational regulatory protein YebC/TACO1
MFMFHRRGRVRVALSEQDVTNGGVDKLFDEAIAAGAEDFDQVPGTGKGVDVEVNPVFPISEFATTQLYLMNLVFLAAPTKIMCAPNALGKVIDGVAQSGLSQGLLSGELVYVPSDDLVGDSELGCRVKELVTDLEELEGTLRVWTTQGS